MLTPLDPAYVRVAGEGVEGDCTSEAERSARARASAASPLDLILTAPVSGAAFKLRSLFDSLRANGVVPHAAEGGFDEAVAAQLVSALDASARAAKTPESSLTPSDLVGVAEGYYPRTIPVTAAAKAAYGVDGTEWGQRFQADIRSQVGDYLQMLGDVAAMGAGRIRRVKQCDAYWACIFPYRESDATFHHYGSTVLPPAEIVTAMEANDASGTTFEPMSATTTLLIACLCFGVKLDLSVFNGGGGLLQNFSPADSHGADAYVPRTQFSAEDTSQDVASLVAAAPAWQMGVLIPAGGRTTEDDTGATVADPDAKGWDEFYTPDGGTAPSAGEFAYQQYVVNVWPTTQGEENVQSSSFALECRRRKCLGIAAFAFKVGDWLYRVDTALRSIGAGTIYDVVDTIDIGSELNQFWATPDLVRPASHDRPPTTEEQVRHASLEVGRYLALLAGPIRVWNPRMQFRIDLETWLPVPGFDPHGSGWIDGFPQELQWVRRVIADGMTREVRWWAAIQAVRYGGAPTAVTDWLASEAAAGFAWPQDPLGVGLPSAGDLLHQVGVNCYHGYNTDSADRPFEAAYASAPRLAWDVARLASTLASIPGFGLTMTVGEIGFAAVDPGSKEATGATEWAPYYDGTSEALQAAMHVRTILTLLASGVESAFPYTFNYGVLPNLASYPGSSFCAWLASASTGLHNDIAYDATGEGGELSYTYRQEVECWPRAAWFANRRLLWLLAQSGARPRASMSVRVSDPLSGLTVIRLVFPSKLSTDPDGAALTTLDGAVALVPVRFAYLVWIDQYGAAEEVHLQFAFPPADESWTLLPLVPLVTPPVAPAPGPHGYAEPSAVDWAWDTTGPDAAALGAMVSVSMRRGPPSGVPPSAPYHGGDIPGSRLSLLVRRCAPQRDAWPSGGVAVAPLCILTSAQLVTP